MKIPTPENIDHWLFDWIEGNLTPEQEEQLRLFLLLNPEFDTDADAWRQSTLSTPEVSEAEVSSFGFAENAMAHKKEKRRRMVPVLWFSTAGLMLAFSLAMLWPITIPTSSSVQAKNQIERKKATVTPQKQRKSNRLDNRTKALNAFQLATKSALMDPLSKPSEASNFASSKKTEINDAIALQGVMLSEESVFSANYPTLKIPRKPFDKLPNSSLTLVTNQAPNKERQSNSHANRFKLNKSSAIAKYVRKDNVSTSLKDRVYCIAEKSHLDLNDGFAGNRSQTRIQTSSFIRDMNGANEKINQQLACDAYVRQIKSGIGLVANYSQFGKGVISEWNVRLIYAPKIALSRYISLEPSLSYTMGQKLLDYSKVNNYSNFTYNSEIIQQFQYDPNLPVGRSLIYRDLSAGAILNLGPIYLGGKVDNLLQHQDNIHTNDFDTLDRARTASSFMLGTDFSANHGKLVFSPMISHWTNGQNQLTQVGASLQMNRWVIGANTSTQKAIGGLVGFQGDHLALFLQSTKSQSILTQQPVYLHQITVRINSNISRKARRYLYL
ncbi:MAG: type IX secretion system membrane protein PorP/SprF [Flavobacteriales bacterium]